MIPRILVVDDDDTVRSLVRTHLRTRGAQVTEAPDGRKGLDIVTMQPIDILVTDLEMPVMGGLELLQRIRERGLLTRCVVLTGYASITNLTGCLREGAIALVRKPLEDFAPLDRAIDEAAAQLQRWTSQMNEIMRLKPASGAKPPADRTKAGAGALEPKAGPHAR